MSDIITTLNLVNDMIFVSLVNTILQMTLLISLVVLFIWIFRVKSAATRYCLWLFVLFAIILLPLLTPFVPQMDFTRFQHQGAKDYRPDDMIKLSMEGSDVIELQEANGSVPPTSAARAASREMNIPLVNPVSVAYFIWCAGMLFMTWRTIGIYGKLRRLRISSWDVEDQTALEILSRLRTRLSIRKAVALKASSEIYSPISMGVFSPVIIVPDSLIENSPFSKGGSRGISELEMILTHELAHIKRCDYLVSMLQNILRAVFLFHPLFHLMYRNLAKEREHICDDWVIDLTRRRSSYAECLLGLLERAVYKPVNIPVTIAMAERKRDIPGRIKMIVDKKRKISTKVSRKALIVMLIIGCLSLPVIGGVGLVRFAIAKPVSNAGKMIFTSFRDGNDEIYVMDADGSNVKRLTNHPKRDYWPAWSPDGTKIAFTSERVNWGDIYIMNADGANVERLTFNNRVTCGISWAPAQKIAFGLCLGGVVNWHIFVIDPDGKNQTQLTNLEGIAGTPAWSPDGKKIAFAAGKGAWDIYIMDADGANVKMLTDHPAWDSDPIWSPDGKKIAFHSNRDGNHEIYVMNADGSNVKRLTDNPADDIGSSWFGSSYGVEPAGKLKSTWGKIKRELFSFEDTPQGVRYIQRLAHCYSFIKRKAPTIPVSS